MQTFTRRQILKQVPRVGIVMALGGAALSIAPETEAARGDITRIFYGGHMERVYDAARKETTHHVLFFGVPSNARLPQYVEGPGWRPRVDGWKYNDPRRGVVQAGFGWSNHGPLPPASLFKLAVIVPQDGGPRA